MIGAAVAPECVPVLVTPPLVDVHVAVWLVIALPLFAPIVNVTVNDPVVVVAGPDTALTFVGAAGEPTITASDGADAAPVPMALVAWTVHEYVAPVVKPVTVNGDTAPVCTPVAPPLVDPHVAVYPVMALPPLLAGAVNVTVSEPVAVVVDPDTAFTPVGASGAVTGVTALDAADGGPVPTAFVAVTVHV